MKKVDVPLNIPNILSTFRFFSFPFVMIFVFIGQQNLFIFFICFNLFTDFLDGWVARKFNQATKIGSVIDSLADTTTIISALTGIIVFKGAYFETNMALIILFFSLFVIADIYPVAKFGKFAGYHTYSAKAGAYVQGLFIVVLFLYGFYLWFFYLVIFSGILAYFESMIITYTLKEPKTNVKGLYWILAGQKKGVAG
jgi:CDP-diacylglycerol--glycerol-3-phosphate 3-phosphatidyltransferase